MRTIGIEEFLAWAYRDELPKAEVRSASVGVGGGGSGAGGWDAVSRLGELMTDMISDGRLNSYGVMSLPIDCGPPHPDALVLHAAVKGLAGIEPVLPDDWTPLGGLGLSIEEQRDAVARALPRIADRDGDGRARLRLKPAELVRRYAILGGCPSWEFDKPKASFVLLHGKPAWFRKVPVEGAFGRVYEQEVDGYNKRAQRPYPSAYRKTELDPDPAMAVVDRAEYEVWHDALAMLVEQLGDGSLKAHRVIHSGRTARPWGA